jgi:hypothetical protein
MVLNPRREEENLEADLAKIRNTTRMRLGIVAGIVIIGFLQTNFPALDGRDLLTGARTLLQAVMPLVFLAVAGTLVVLALARRDQKRVEAAYESRRFRIPKRKKPSDKS